MSKGSKPAGNTTVTQVNPTQQAQAPFLTGLWNSAQNLGASNPLQYFPGNTLPGGYDQLANFGSGAFSGTQGYAQAAQTGALAGANSLMSGGNPAAGQAFGLNNLYGLGLQNANSAGSAARDQIAGLNNIYGEGLQNYTLGQNNINNGLSVANPSESALMANSGMAIGGNPALRSLMGEASGQYLNSNPALSGMFNAAAQPVVNAYQTATAPQTDSNFERSGRYGSGAAGSAQSVNEQNLGTTLGNLSSNIYGQDYANERGLQTQAGNALGNIFNTGVSNANSALSNAGSLALGGVNASNNALYASNNALATGANALGAAGQLGIGDANAVTNALNGAAGALGTGGQLNISGLNPMLSAMGMAPGLSGMSTTDLQNMIAGNQAPISDAMNRFYGNQQAPWQTLGQESALLGNPVTGSGTTTTPYFQNGAANALGALTGGVGLANGLFGTGSGGLLGGKGAKAAAAPFTGGLY